jgi:hypothetical protein
MTASELPPNIKEFNEITAVTLGQLYIAFPVPQRINPDEVAAVLGLANRRQQMPSGRAFNDLLDHTLKWLRDEHFIQSNPHLAGANDLLLTTKGLAAMSAVPPSLNRPLGSELADATKEASTEGGKTRISQMMGDFFGSFAGSFTKTFTG